MTKRPKTLLHKPPGREMASVHQLQQGQPILLCNSNRIAPENFVQPTSIDSGYTLKINLKYRRLPASTIHDGNISKLIYFLKERLGNITPPQNNPAQAPGLLANTTSGDSVNTLNLPYATFINTNISSMISHSDGSKDEKTTLKHWLERVMSDKLNDLNYSQTSPFVRNSIFYCIEYAKQQSAEFKKAYIQTFTSDYISDYRGAKGMTCYAGPLDRIVLSLIPACQIVLSAGVENKEYETLLDIIAANPEKRVPAYIREWYTLHKSATDSTVDEKRADLRRYLIEKLPGNDAFIDYKIAEIVDNIGYGGSNFFRQIQ